MRRALGEYRIIGIKTNIPFHQQMMDTTSFIGGRFDTTYLEKRFTMTPEDRGRYQEVAAVVATLLAHQRRQQALTFSIRQERGMSPWKTAGRREAMHR